MPIGDASPGLGDLDQRLPSAHLPRSEGLLLLNGVAAPSLGGLDEHLLRFSLPSGECLGAWWRGASWGWRTRLV